MEATLNFSLPLTFQQIVVMVKQMPKPKQSELLEFLQNEVKEQDEPTFTHLAAQEVLAKDWLNQEEEEAWKNL